jgi:cysteine synthase A
MSRQQHGVTCLVFAAAAAVLYIRLRRAAQTRGEDGSSESEPVPRCIGDGVLGAIGNTPLVRIASLSAATGCEVYAKAEFCNPGGSVKDRVAVRMLRDALDSGALRAGGLVTEGTAGSTGISLALVAPALGVRCHIVMPDDVASEKSATISALGASVQRVRPVSITHPEHFVNVARRLAAEECSAHGHGAAFFADQFENTSNYKAHVDTTGPEIWRQTGGKVHAFVAGAGTGGTLAGVASYLKRVSGAKVACYLADPPGSGLYNAVMRGVFYDSVEAEGKRLRHPADTIVEGVGINRRTANWALCPQLQGAFRVTDAEAVAMARHLRHADGLWVGSSAAVNCVGALRVAQALGKGHTIVTVLCDGGSRHVSRFWDDAVLQQHGLQPPPRGTELDSLLTHRAVTQGEVGRAPN